MAKLNKSTGKEKVKPIRIQASPASEHREYASDEVNEFGEYIKIGGSPVPGLTLRHVLRGHTDVINGIAWSPDGKYLASSSYDKTIRIFDVNTGECACVLEGHTDGVNCVAWSPNGSKFASGALNGELKIWGVKDNAKLNILFTLDRGKKYRIYSIHWSRNGSFIAAQTNGGVIFIDIKSNYSTKYELSAGGATSWCHNINMLAFAGNFDNAFYVRNFDKKFKTNKFDLNASGFINCLCWSPDDRLLALGDMKKNDLLVWDSESKEIVHKLHGHPNLVLDLFWISSKILASVSHADPTVRIWDVEKGEQIICLEGHVDLIKEIVISNDRSLIASAARDNTVKIWDANRFILLATINKIFNDDRIDIEFSFDNLSLAITSNNEKIILLWELDKSVLLGQAEESVNYTTAKLVLVGDSGVGKTGLGWRLAHNEFKEQASTHGQQFWPVSQLNLKRKDGTDCEAVLWDLAGQHVYRQVHSIFLDNVAAAMVLFDPTNRQEPLKGAQFWLEQLKGKGELPPTVLVGARVDRGAPALSQAELDQFCQRYGIKGGYISTSAMNGDGLEALLDILKEQIPWDEMTATVTTVTFKRIKDYVLSLKEKTDRKGVLVAPDALRAQLQATDSEWSFTDAEMMTAVGHLETHGYVSILSNSAGDKFILLTPELLASLAASIMLLADKNPRELGAVNETELLGGKISFDD
ncbi:MAG: GTP-binding protein, partial [Chlorobaculum sp.]|nr:GTP-binding protein [Chlorobaculum sp.]